MSFGALTKDQFIIRRNVTHDTESLWYQALCGTGPGNVRTETTHDARTTETPRAAAVAADDCFIKVLSTAAHRSQGNGRERRGIKPQVADGATWAAVNEHRQNPRGQVPAASRNTAAARGGCHRKRSRGTQAGDGGPAA